jgi:ribonuclease T2
MDKTECKQATSDRYDAKHFTLHGLWPNQRTCRDEYGFCGQVHAEQRDFCDYPEVALTPQLRERLGEVMPSVAYGTCLERHEWWKHGTCWAGAPEAYFTEAMRLVRFINESAVVSEVVSAAIGKSVDASELLRAIDAAFGNGASKKFELSCNRQKELVEVRVSLPATIQPDEPLPALLERAPNANAGCTGPLRIVAYGN